MKLSKSFSFVIEVLVTEDGSEKFVLRAPNGQPLSVDSDLTGIVFSCKEFMKPVDLSSKGE